MSTRRQILIALPAAGLSLTTPFSSAFAATTPKRKEPSLCVLDFHTGQFVLGENQFEKRHPASLTKMMAAEPIMNALKDRSINFSLDSLVTIPNLVLEVESGIRIIRKIKPGDKVKAKTLLTAMGGYSDAYSTLALALHLGSPEVYDWGGSEHDKFDRFVSEMNKRAIDIEMYNSKFRVITGVPSDDHYSTAYDMALLMKHLQNKYPDLSEIAFGQPSFDLRPFFMSAVKHTSSLLRSKPDFFKWAKTGITNEAGFCLGAYYKKGDVSLIGVELGAKNDLQRNRLMLSMIKEASQQIMVAPKPVL